MHLPLRHNTNTTHPINLIMQQVNIILTFRPATVAILTDIKAVIKDVVAEVVVADASLQLDHAIPPFTAGRMVVAVIQVQCATPSSPDIRTVPRFRTKWAATLTIAPPDIWGPTLEYNLLPIT
jgi:hypothetical protein